MTHRLNRSASKMSRSPSRSRQYSSEKITKESPQKLDVARRMSKPVVSSTLKVEDIPIDLRHRRCSSARTRSSPKGGESPASGRSCSLKSPCQRQSYDYSYSPNGSTQDNSTDSRTSFCHSLSLPSDSTEFHRLRNFSITSKGIINRGDSFRTRSASTSRSSTPKTPPAVDTELTESVVSKFSELHDGNSAGCSTSLSISRETSHGDTTQEPPPKCKVWLLGSNGVGKSSLKQQFMTSEYICQYENWRDDNATGSVTVVIDGNETELEIVECSSNDEKVKVSSSPPDAYVVVYDVTNKKSFVQAKHILAWLQSSAVSASRPAILVGNKTDLARLRAISTVGRSCAKVRGFKFIETSVAINHQVDELLVGIVAQIRIKNGADEKLGGNGAKSDSTGYLKFSQSVRQKNKAARIIKRLWKRACMTSKSCDNLHAI